MADKSLRSQRSYGKIDRDGFIHRSWIKATGLPDHVFDGRPIIGIANTWSELVTCQVHLRDLWAREDLGTTSRIALAVPSHGARMVKVWQQ